MSYSNFEIPDDIYEIYVKSDKEINESLADPKSKKALVSYLKHSGVYGKNNKPISKYGSCGVPGLYGYACVIKSLKDKSISDFYRLNSKGFRCDEFTTAHSNKHILFAGCSVSYGDSLELEDTWTYQVFKRISAREETSGYYNISSPGATLLDIAVLIHEYFETYGIPDVLFVNLPDLKRLFPEESDPRMETSITIALELLWKSICEMSGLQVYITSWDEETTSDYRGNTSVANDFRTQLQRFFSYSKKDLETYIYDYFERAEDKALVFRALDNSHPGVGYHNFWAEFLYNIYEGERE